MKHKNDKRIREIEDQIDKLRDELTTLRDQRTVDNSPIKIGDKIAWRNKVGIVTRIVDTSDDDSFHYYANPILKSGSLGQNVKVWSFYNPKKVA